MIKTMTQIIENESLDTIENALKAALDRSDESPFWAQKALPLAHAVLSVCVPLRDRNLLFDPEGNPSERLTPELLLRWCDLVSLKTLAFTLQQSNQTGKLVRTKYHDTAANRYEAVDLADLGSYLGGYMINLENESLDFPIAHYNLHIGVAGVLEKLMK